MKWVLRIGILLALAGAVVGGIWWVSKSNAARQMLNGRGGEHEFGERAFGELEDHDDDAEEHAPGQFAPGQQIRPERHERGGEFGERDHGFESRFGWGGILARLGQVVLIVAAVVLVQKAWQMFKRRQATNSTA